MITTNEQLKDKLESEAEYKISVLGVDVFIKDIETLLRCGHHTGIIEANRSFYKLEIKIQELLVKQITELLKYEISDSERYFKSDESAIKFMVDKYPTTSNSFWISQFIELINPSRYILHELNRDRISRVIKLKLK